MRACTHRTVLFVILKVALVARSVGILREGEYEREEEKKEKTRRGAGGGQ